MSRIIVIGGPRTGKTTFAKDLSQRLGHPMKHTDDLIGKLDWSGASMYASSWFDAPGPWIVEGVAAVRALRKWLAANDGIPCDRIYWLSRARLELTPGQAAMAKGCHTVWREILPELRRRGVAIEAQS